ncbi:MAG TPA: sigma-54 dependent transcriptional regulator [Pelagibacterium sp.]|uniref:sigma-54 dependent transcriptional regulator n=1 Tax=Pelagibacterium sp. TaxID=1967288 RepID=UPI002CA7B95E|nr:sigma-54 dependent transcriptional regulator [Pelagibacterium sp.]HWJ89168.1 sigma-54 dependent transcriptional regulator [Pelagibacterium sp.]
MRDGPPSDADVKLLLIDSAPDRARTTMATIFGHWGKAISLVHCTSFRQALDSLRNTSFDVILAETGSIDGPTSDGEAAFASLAASADGALIVALADGGSVSLAVAAMRAGAHDYLALPISGPVLAARLGELGQRHGKARAIVCETPKTLPDFEGFVGTTPQMQAIYDQILRIAPSAAPVFITGESGTGKEVSAAALHKRSPRADKPFIAINAGAIPRELMEAEVFGAIRGAYTGAHEDRKGAIEMADKGTLFLDEIGEMDLALQAKLLRFLQTGTITRVGESVARAVDVRVICATNRNPMQLVSERKFREDLFYRLHVLPIHLPPLRQRPGDIMPLAQSFLTEFAREESKRFSGFAPDVADLFVAREWPGNVRQLQNLVRRIVVMFDGGLVSAQMAFAADYESRNAYVAARPAAGIPTSIEPMWRQEQRIIEDALDAFGGNIARAAAALEISPSTIYRKKLGWERAGAA